jgi:hypothetical protein
VAAFNGEDSTQASGAADETATATLPARTPTPTGTSIGPTVVSPAAGQEFREQPPMLEVESGQEWRLFVADDGLGMPEPGDAVLVLSGQRVDVLDRDGRVAMSVRTGAEPIPAINVPRGELVVSDFVSENGIGRHRLLLFDLASPRLLGLVELDGIRVRFHDIYGQALAISGDGRWLYWDRHDSPELGQRDSRHVWRAVDLETRKPLEWSAPMPEFCGGRGSLAPYGPSAMVAHCPVVGGPFLMEAGLLPELREAPGDAPHAGWKYRGGYAGDYVLAIEGYIPSPTLQISDAVTGVALANQQTTNVLDVVLIDTRQALLLKEDGTLQRIDVWTGDTETLPYRQPVRRYGEVALVR